MGKGKNSHDPGEKYARWRRKANAPREFKSQPRQKRRQPETHPALKIALRYAKEGTPIIWIPPCSKAPIARGWPSLATTDALSIKKWGADHPDCNFGLVMGNGIIAIDVDDASVIPSLKAQGLALPPTRLHGTPGGGFHLLYHVPPDAAIKNAVRVLPGIDVRAAGGQIVCPGSKHPNGGIYTIKDNSPIAPLPGPWLKQLTQSSAKRITTRGTIAEGKRNNHLTSAAGALHARGLPLPQLIAQLLLLNAKECDPPLDEDEVLRIAKSVDAYPVPTNVAELLNDAERVRVALPTDNRLLGDFAAELSKHLRGTLYRHGRDVVAFEDSAMRVISAQELRTRVERRVICYRVRSTRGGSVDVGVTMSAEEARGVLASSQFLAALDPVKTVTACRVPVKRADGRIELLPDGYDAESQTMTLASGEYRDDMPFNEALAVLRDLFGEFEFADIERSRAVAVCALVGLYAQQLLPADALRPAIVYTKNAEGAGASLAVACAVVPVVGDLPTGSKPGDDEELRKLLTSSLRQGRRLVLLDNIKGVIGGAALEAFCSAATWSDRVLGANELVTLPNNITVFATGNGATLTPDMRRRSLVCELHLSIERAEDRQFKRPLNVAVLKTMRPRILSACWSLVRHWDAQGRPQPSRSHSAFPEWAGTIAGIVEAAGYRCPLDTPITMFAPDEDGDNMRALVAAMKPARAYDAAQLYALCRVEQIFTPLVGMHEGDMGKAQLSTMGRLLARYHNRLVGKSHFVIAGTGHARRFFAKTVSSDQHGRMVEHGVSLDPLKLQVLDPKSKHRADHADHTTQPATPVHKPLRFTRSGSVSSARERTTIQ